MTQSHHSQRRAGPGRPRHIEKPGAPTERARDEVLDAAARLFAERGYANTSTRQIAEAVGIRQASLYYHFAEGKRDMLVEVLSQTVRPTLASVDVVENMAEDPATALYLLALLDVETLVSAPHNSGRLGMLPDVAKEAPEFAEAHTELAFTYGRLAARVAPQHVMESAGKQLGGLLVQNVETVITWISDESYREYSTPDVIASSCLRLCGVEEARIETARMAAHERLPEVSEVA